MSIALVSYYFMLSYAGIGLVYTIHYMIKSMQSRDEDTIQTTPGIKAVFIPGLVLTWPITILHWKKPIDSYSNNVQDLQSSHLRSWILMAIALPLLTILALIYIPYETVDQPIRYTPLVSHPHILSTQSASHYTVNLRGTYPDSLQVEVLSTQAKPYANQTLLLNKDHRSYVLGQVTGNHVNLFSLPPGSMPGQINLTVQDEIKHVLLCEITF